ncbi:MAG: hypothetical protein JOZ24_04290 [Candidatus Eremiobacteraeota bacterium]|nr:hypothetical protein [Candidatus Eremiobacteraeota bacterium]
MSDEALFCRRFVDDVRRCAAGRAPASVAEIERRVDVAMVAPLAQRERSWAHVVAAVNELLAGVPPRALGPAARLRAFARENADLGRPRDLAITDFRFEMRTEGVLTAGGGRRYLVFARIPRAPNPPALVLDEVVPAPTRRLAEWAVYGLCGGAAAAALWFAFIVPV